MQSDDDTQNICMFSSSPAKESEREWVRDVCRIHRPSQFQLEILLNC